MSDFTLALAILGGLTLAGVVGHGAWTRRNNRIRQPEPLTAEEARDRVSMLPEGLSGYFENQRPSHLSLTEDSEIANHGHSLDQVSAWTHQLEKKPRPDPLIDSMALITCDQEVSGEAILAHLPATRRVGSKTIQIESESTTDGVWEFPHPGRRYQRVQVGVQLANRTGPLTEIEFSEFLVKVGLLADALGGVAETAEMRPEILKARELDQFAAIHDTQFSLHLFSRKVAWSTGFVHQCAARLGFVAGALPGRMVLPANEPGAAPLLALSFDSQAALANTVDGPGIRHLSLTLDIPQVPRQDKPLMLMREIADLLSVSMDAVVTDENANAVSNDVLDQVVQDLQQVYDRLQERELDAGSALARRLFS